MEELFNRCNLCPRGCNVNRNKGEIGYCGASNKMKIGGYRLHMWEEPIISGDSGSGTVFFSYCNLRCVYCQNYDISTKYVGEEISVERFANICLELQEMGANNINLVTPSHYIPLIRDGIILAKKMGVTICFVYNSSGYDSVSSLKLLEGLIDIYLPDFKYYSRDLFKYSNVSDYYNVASLAIEEMYRQVGKPKYNGDILESGVIVRHLVLPGCFEDSKRIIKYLYDKYGDNIILSIMDQYTPVRKTKYSELNSCVKESEYDDVVNYAYDIGVRNAFIQEESSQSDSFIPIFKGDEIV